MKYGKRYVHYRRAPSSSRTCHNCASMNEDGTCKKVEGQVKPADVCDLWSPKHGQRTPFPVPPPELGR